MAHPDGGPSFWTQFCAPLDLPTLLNPFLLLWSPLSHSPSFRCQLHGIALCLLALASLCVLSHILILRKKRPTPAQTDAQAAVTNGEAVTNGGTDEKPSAQAPRTVQMQRLGLLFWTSCLLSLALALLWASLSMLLVLPGIPWKGPATIDEVAYSGGQAFAWATAAGALWACQSRSMTVLFSTARVAYFLYALLELFLAPSSFHLLLPSASFLPGSAERILQLLSLPVSLLLGFLAYTGYTGVMLVDQPVNPLIQPLLLQGAAESEQGPKLCETVTGYESSGIIPTVLFQFVVPVLDKGSDAVLTADDVPQMRPCDRTRPAYALFRANWERLRQARPDRSPPVTRTLWASFWGILLFTAFLALLKTGVMYVGPLLLSSFVDYAANGAQYWGQGAVLVLSLLAAQALGTVFDNQQNFRSELLGMYIQSSLVSALFHKGLRLSSKAKQESSVGEIVNYMSTDVQRLKDLCWELHNIWVLPLQIVLALVILFWVVGISMLSGLGVMLGIMVCNLLVATQQHKCMTNIMDCKDARMKATTEALKSMRVIKLYAWQDQFRFRIEELRGNEMSWLTRFMYIAAINIFLLWLSPLVVSVATFATMLWLGLPLSPGAVFTAIATFRILQEPLRSFPGVISSVTQAMVSLRRLSAFLSSPELQHDAVTRIPSAEFEGVPSEGNADTALSPAGPPLDFAVAVEDATFSWEDDSGNLTLSGISLQVKAGSRVAVCGAVGSGKSSLLSAILGEVPKLQGKVTVVGSTAYVPQSAWIQNCTVKDNILFGLPYEEAKYKEVLRCCALEKDLLLFSHGDETQIGERGVNLSGGQKQRIQLARALYHGADIFLLDDPFSAVDAHTGSDLFMEYILGALSGKTVVLVTHQVEFLPAADIILVMKEGRVVQSGTYNELLNEGTDFGSLVDAHNEAMKSVDSASALSGMEEEAKKASSDGKKKGVAKGPEATDEGVKGSEAMPLLTRKASRESQEVLAAQKGKEGVEGGGSGQLIQEEEKESGQVSGAVYWAYITKALKGFLPPFLLSVQLVWQMLQIGSDWWLAAYSSQTASGTSPTQFLRVYALLALGSGVFVLMRTAVVSWAGIRITQGFYEDMLRSVFRAPMSFFDSTPIGRILSRSSTDQNALDMEIPFSFGSLLAMCFALFGILFVSSYVTWPVIFVVVPLTYFYVSLQHYYLTTSRELTRLNGITKAPIIEHFSESLAGAAVVRAFGQQERFAAKSMDLVDTNNRIYFHYGATTLWMGVHLELIGTFVLCFSAFMLISLPSSIVSPGLAGMSLSYGLALSQGLFYVVWVWCALENEMVSVERIQQYSTLPSEAPLTKTNARPPVDWPSTGAVEFNNLQIRYREDLPKVLNGITLHIEGGTKVGVVGRTGSGKSTLIAALFRLVEPCGGEIIIDDVDITQIGLADLRLHLSIIPQEPTLFEGTVRYNLDPMEQYSDAQVWEALEKCQLAEAVGSDDEKLSASVTEGGENWSVGQRQLFCLGRALLKSSKILVLDEATASVDSATDAVIQKTIRDNFGGCTVISIAHRIPTVMDSDKVLVMEQGLVAEFDSPSKLLEDRSSMFFKLVAEYSARSSDMVDMARSSSVENFSTS